ncbi:MAG: hypothetical protein M3Y64_03995 [Gemmatimonadota bacterium]|nr:hypothetical protein [Gemmatimonadota bacterium]
MIVRVWSARAIAAKLPLYLVHFHDIVLPHMRALSGFVGATVMHREIGIGEIEIVVQTRWQSMMAVRTFAGDDADIAVVERAAVALLNDYDRTARHFDIEIDTSAEEKGR